MFYWLAPRLWNTKLYSNALANAHFWLGMVGILLYVASMWVAGITQGLMLNATAEGGTILQYPNFLDTLQSIKPVMLFRAIGGGLYLTGFGLLAFNIWKTARSGNAVNGTVEIPQEAPEGSPDHRKGGKTGFSTFLNAPIIYAFLLIFFVCVTIFNDGAFFIFGMVMTIFVVVGAIAHFELSKAQWTIWYEQLLDHSFAFTALTIIAAAIGGAIQIIPTVTVQRADNIEGRIQVPYTPLELAGRDLYVSEGCYNCHSQMIRTMVPEVLRYGDYSHLGESIYDFPFQWGSKRTGPDLAREGGKRSDDWHYYHMLDPRSVSPGSTMPNYPWLFEKDTKVSQLPNKIRAMRMLGVPYPIDLSEEDIQAQVDAQAAEIVESLAEKGAFVEPEKEIVAIIAYLQKLGTYREAQQIIDEAESQNSSEIIPPE
jgi:cytochrome c oxidase cbb3-type subunit I/II